MSASAHIYLVMDAGSPVAAFTVQHEMKAYLKRRLETRNYSKPAVDNVHDRLVCGESHAHGRSV
jgi:hypothetical protein